MFVEAKIPDKFKAERLDVPDVLNPPAVMLLVAVRLFEMLSEPAKVDEPVPLKVALPVLMVNAVPVIAPELIAPAVVKDPAVMPLVAVKDFAMFKLPANELEPVPVEINIPAVSMLLVAWIPLDELILPEKELEPVPPTVKFEPAPVVVIAPEELILVTTKAPALIAPAVVKDPAVMPLVAVILFAIFKLPAKELEPIPVERIWAMVVKLPLA